MKAKEHRVLAGSLAFGLTLACAFVLAGPEPQPQEPQEPEEIQEEREEQIEEKTDALAVLVQANDVLQTMMTAQAENRIPPRVLQQAAGVAIFPNVTKVAVAVGGRYGEGVLLKRLADGWSAPVFVNLYGGSIGLQLGATASDLVLIFSEAEDVEDVMEAEFSLGADATLALGPWGAKSEQSTAADILVYNQTEGVFAGIDLSGSILTADEEANAGFHGGTAAGDILTAAPKPGLPEPANQLRTTLDRYAGMARGTEE